ncbi:hypothetical protein PLICRDRAFT_174023 [Plicaturopsis crispa FD-325 SS-3]|nr:hypothetical protein PLICRDRAFT_174023 [Plicaturopsis crispa FD-325 SS-3]
MSTKDASLKGSPSAAHQEYEVHAPPAGRTGLRGLAENPFILKATALATLGGFLFGYDQIRYLSPKKASLRSYELQGVVGNILVLENFGAAFPSIYMNASIKGWYVSTLLLATWLGSLINGPICDKIGRKRDIIFSVVIFLLGSALQTGAVPGKEAYLFAGRAISGLSIGALTHVVPMYLAEISSANVRGSLVALQQLSITLGILFSCSTRCAPGTPYTGPLLNGSPTFDAYNDVPAGGCTGQTEASWRIPVGLQMLPALVLGFGMTFMPYSPRWLVEVDREEEALHVLSRLRRQPVDHPNVRFEFLEIKAEVTFTKEARVAAKFQDATWFSRAIAPYLAFFVSWPKFRRLAVGCLVMFYQQFMGCNAIIYYAPTIFGQLGLDPNTTSLLATGVYGIVNTISTIPAVILLDTVGRRPLLMTGALGCLGALIVVGSLIAAYGHDWPAHPMAGHAAIAFVYIYDVNFSYSWAPIGWVLPSEIFPLALRSTGISITTSATWMSNFIIGLVSPMMLANLDHGGTYFFFAAFSLLAFLTTYFLFPETKGRNLEEMDAAFGDNATTVEVERMKTICSNLGLPERALVSV